jgi:hypothetical protein
VNLVAFTGAMLSIRSLLQDQASLLERARAAGEELSPDVA